MGNFISLGFLKLSSNSSVASGFRIILLILISLLTYLLSQNEASNQTIKFYTAVSFTESTQETYYSGIPLGNVLTAIRTTIGQS